MEIDAKSYDSTLLKIARIELKKRADEIEALKCELRSVSNGNNVLLFCALILAALAIF